jgi:hypothetical protein
MDLADHGANRSDKTSRTKLNEPAKNVAIALYNAP